MSDRVNQIREALDEYDETDSVAIIRDLHTPAYVDVFADAARDFADLLTRLEDGSLVGEVAKAMFLLLERLRLDLKGRTPTYEERMTVAEAVLTALGLQESE